MMTRRSSTNARAYATGTLYVWILTLVLVWLIFCSPWSIGWTLTLAVLAVLVGISALFVAFQSNRSRRIATQEILADITLPLHNLPAGLLHNTPLVLVAGDAVSLQASFGDTSVRLTDAAIWIRVTEVAQLMYIADALMHWRDGQGPEAIIYLMHTNDPLEQTRLRATLLSFRSAISETSRAIGYRLPTGIAMYLQDNALPSTNNGIWFGATGSEPLKIASVSEHVASALAQYSQFLPPQDAMRRRLGYLTARVDALAQWASSTLLPTMTDQQGRTEQVQLLAFGVTTVTGATARQSAFSRFSATRTGLMQRDTVSSALSLSSHSSSSWPLPDILLPAFPLRLVRPALPATLAHALVWALIFFAGAAAASAWQNRELVQTLHRHVQLYETILPVQDAARVEALAVLKQDRDTLEFHLRTGVPLRLGMGFYQGRTWLSRIDALIAGYTPPAPLPVTIELDSMSLFNSASAVLHPDANRALVSALEMIKSYTDKRVLIAGHSDSTGDSKSNQKLSEERATAVRDWLADASGIPTSRFAIQGYGDTRPKAGNDTAAGRAANRRVEITLVPDCRNQRPPGQMACLFN